MQAGDKSKIEGSSITRPIAATTQYPLYINLISPPLCYCDLQEGLNS